LQERLQASARRDIVFRFGNQNLVIPKNLVISLPFYGNMLYNFLAWHAGLLRKFRARKSERAAHPMDNPEN
jgi:hypothetical protein